MKRRPILKQSLALALAGTGAVVAPADTSVVINLPRDQSPYPLYTMIWREDGKPDTVHDWSDQPEVWFDFLPNVHSCVLHSDGSKTYYSFA